MHTISLYICLSVCFPEQGILQAYQKPALPGALLTAFCSGICLAAVLHCKWLNIT